MEPLTSATAFATIVSLIAQFRAEHGASAATEADEFMSWLAENRHSEIKELLELNTGATIGIKALLSVNQTELIEKLEQLDSALAIYASSLPEFVGLAATLRPNSTLSDQALSILNQLEKSGGSKILEMHANGFIILKILDGSGGSIEADDLRFIEDDLKTLVEFGLLRHDYNSSGNNLYLLTRAASKFVASLSNKL